MIDVFGDFNNPDVNIMHMSQGGLGLPDEAYYREDHYAPIRDAYVRMVARQLTNAGYAHADDEAREQAQRLLDVETAIAAHHWDNVSTRDSQKTNNPTEFAELKAMLADFGIEAWAQAVQRAYDAAHHWDNVSTRDSQKTNNPTEFAELKAMLADFGIEAWAQAVQRAYDASATAGTYAVDVLGALAHVNVMEPSFFTGLNEFWRDAQLDDLKLWARVHTIVGRASMLSRDFDCAHDRGPREHAEPRLRFREFRVLRQDAFGHQGAARALEARRLARQRHLR